MNNKKRNVFWLVMGILFYPFGLIVLLVWLLRRLHAEPEKYERNSVGVMIYGWVLIAVAAVYLLAAVTGSVEAESTGDVIFGVCVMLALCGGGGWALVRHGRKYRKLAELREKYLPIIACSEDGNMDKMGISLGLPYDAVRQELQLLIRHKALPDSYIDPARRVLVSSVVGTSAVRTERRSVICPHCGGVSRIVVGGKNLCEYCDSVL